MALVTSHVRTIMTNPFKLKPEERVKAWSDFRDSLKNFQEDVQLKMVAEFWKMCPFQNWTIDAEDPKSWPSMWEMLDEGYYCMNSVAYGIESTLRMAGWDPSRLELTMIRHTDMLCGEYFVVKIDGNKILNYSYGEIIPESEIRDKIKCIYSLRYSGRGYKKI